ncbi:MAG TPA: hypothetical protein VNZ52_10455 [Candidatus Thermoplasmatota archaeon]|nr:hypothetical protein [Candidatus Thermoplasmatota archaeon]
MASVLATRTAPAAPLTLRGAVEAVRRQEPLLFWAGVGHLVLAPLFLALAPFDGRTILGVDPWVKPTKFTLSIGIYLITIAALLLPLAASRTKGFIRQTSVWTMVGEMAIIVAQAARGTTSHFNIATPLDAVLFQVMGILIMAATAAAIALLVLYLKPVPVAKPVRWGIRLGLLVMLIGSAAGGQMVANQGHTVGGEDGGAGLPFLTWSTEHGDLRAAHFLGLHGLQVLPLLGLAVAGRARHAERVVMVAAVVYAVAVLFLYVHALLGRPLLAL